MSSDVRLLDHQILLLACKFQSSMQIESPDKRKNGRDMFVWLLTSGGLQTVLSTEKLSLPYNILTYCHSIYQIRSIPCAERTASKKKALRLRMASSDVNHRCLGRPESCEEHHRVRTDMYAQLENTSRKTTPLDNRLIN